MKYLLFFIISITLSCKSHDKTVLPTAEMSSQPAELNLLFSDSYGGAMLEEIQLIRKQEGLKRFMAEINKTRKPRLPIPQVDFGKELVVIYCSGKTSVTEIPRLYRLAESDDKLILGIVKQQAVPESSQTASLLPFSLYTLPLTEKEIVLEKSK